MTERKERPMVSVVMPCYNGGEFLEESVQSILGQSMADFELIICDDASSDSSLAILKQITDPRVRLHENERNIGYLQTINKLFGMARGNFIAFQDADDVSHSRRLAIQLDYLKSHPEVILCGTNFKVISADGAEVTRENVETDPEQLKHGILQGNPFQKPSILFRRELLQEIGGYREGFLRLRNISEDFDWLLRASEHFALGNVNFQEPLYLYRSLPGAMSKGYQNVEQLFGHDIALWLAEQRRVRRGPDDLDLEHFESIEVKINQLAAPFRKDVTLFHRVKAEQLMYCGLRDQAVKHCLEACRLEPFRFRNWRILQHCLRRRMVEKVASRFRRLLELMKDFGVKSAES
jgi:Glycosyl transferase family 2